WRAAPPSSGRAARRRAPPLPGARSRPWPRPAWTHCLAPGMRTVVDAAQMARVDVAVDLRRRERAVAEQFLDRAQVRAAVQEMRGESVPEPVRVGDDAAQGARVEA